MLKIRGLWRFDGDDEPLRVSRRRFVFQGACTAAGVALAGLERLRVAPGEILASVLVGASPGGGLRCARFVFRLGGEELFPIYEAGGGASTSWCAYTAENGGSPGELIAHTFTRREDGERFLAAVHTGDEW